MKKAFVAIAILAILLTSAVGCGQSGSSTTNATTPAAQATNASTTSATATSATKVPAANATATSAPKTSPTAASQSNTSSILANATWMSNFSADAVITDATGKIMKASLAVKGKNMRMDIEADGQKMAIIVNEAQKAAYMYNPAEKSALKMDAGSDTLNMQMDDPSSLLGQIKPDTKPIGTETVNGKTCAIYEVKTDTGTSKAWLATDNGFPMRTEETTAEGVVKSEFSNVKTGNVSDSLFELPAGTEILDMGGMSTTGN